MKRRLASLAFCVAAGALPALAQQTPAPQLTSAQSEGRGHFAKSCSICHLPPQYGAATYGPRLDQTSLGGNESVMREVISNGTPRMPAFKHNFRPAQIDAIIAYLTSVPAPARAAASGASAPVPAAPASPARPN